MVEHSLVAAKTTRDLPKANLALMRPRVENSGYLDRDEVYAVDSFHVAADVRKWCLAEMVDPTTPYRGPRYRHPRVRIALCGYNDEHDAHLPDDWERVHWVGPKGYAKAALAKLSLKEAMGHVVAAHPRARNVALQRRTGGAPKT